MSIDASETPRSDSERRARAALDFYGPLAAARDPARRVGWESAAIQRVRLEALARAIGPLDRRASVLDAGCGEGALLPILRRRGFTGTYRGEDLLAGPIAHAVGLATSDLVPGHSPAMPVLVPGGPADPKATFAVADSFAAGPVAAAVVCSGALNTESGAASHDAEVALALTALWERTTEILAIDLAVADRHAPGVGLARADLGKAFAHARSLTSIVTVREDLVPGEALLILARSRSAGLSWSGADPLDRVEVLLMAGEASEALARLETLSSTIPEARADLDSAATSARIDLLRGSALGALQRPAEALAALDAAAAHPLFEARARLAQAPLLWRLGQKAQAERVLTELASRDDEARAHLASLLSARGEHTRAVTVANAIGDAWIRREVLAALGPKPR
jgi:SAM-dependent methyltransferase